MWFQLLIALGYASTSFGITIINKVVLTSYKFPSYQFLGVCQIVATITLLSTARLFGLVNYPNFSFSVVRKIFPLPLFYIGNMVTGLGATQKINLPMFTVLRRFSILMTMIGELMVLHKRFGRLEQFSVALMLSGAVVAASHDLSFDAFGYTMIMMNNLCTALSNIYQKKKVDAKDVGEFGILYYNSLVTFVPAICILYLTDDISAIISASAWNDVAFCVYFVLSSVMGFLLMYSMMLSNVHISPTSTTVIGTLKNILVAYIGMFIGGDYQFDLLNFCGLNVSLVGGILHSAKSFGLEPTTLLRLCHSRCCKRHSTTTQATRGVSRSVTFAETAQQSADSDLRSVTIDMTQSAALQGSIVSHS